MRPKFTHSLKKRVVGATLAIIFLNFSLFFGIELFLMIQHSKGETVKTLTMLSSEKKAKIDACFTAVENDVKTTEAFILQTIDEERILRDAAYEKDYMEVLKKQMTLFTGLPKSVIALYFRMEVEKFGGTRGFFLSGSPKTGFISVKNTDICRYSPTDTEHVGWYYIPIWKKAPVWTAPYLNKNLNVYMISYIIPVYKEGVLLGVVGMDINLAAVKSFVDDAPADGMLNILIGEEGNLIHCSNKTEERSLVAQTTDISGMLDRFQEIGAGKLTTFNWNNKSYTGMLTKLDNGMTLIVSTSSDTFIRVFLQHIIIFFAILVLLLVIGLISISYALGRIINPIREMSEATFKLSRGEMQTYVTYESKNELGQLAENIRKMTVQMREYIDYVREQTQKERELKEQAQAQSQSKSAFLAKLYLSMHEIDLTDNSFREVQAQDHVTDAISNEPIANASAILPHVMKQLSNKQSWDTIIPFVNLATLNERMGSRITIAQEFLGDHGSWCRGRFIAMDRNDDGSLRHVLWAVENIHEERSVREKLHEEAERSKAESQAKNEFLAKLYLSMHEIDLETNRFHRIQARDKIDNAVNEAEVENASDVLTFAMKQTSNKRSWDDILPFVDLSTIQERMKNRITIAQEFLGSSGIWCRGRFIAMDRNEDGSLRHVMWAVENINEERSAREKLREEAERSRAESQAKNKFLASMYLSLHEIDLNADTFQEIQSRADIAETIGTSFKNARATVRRVMEERVQNQGQARKEFMDFINFDTLEERIKGKSTIAHEFYSIMGYWCRARFIAMDRNADGTLHHVLWAVEDINEERAERERLQGEVAKSIAASQAKSAFLANMSHEIRTPINAVLGMDEMILRECEDDTILGYAANIKNAGSSLLAIINDILDFSKIEAGKMELIPENYDISSVIIDLVNMIRERAAKKGLAFELHVNPSLPKTLHGDSVRIKQCILNLLTNAVKYTPKGTVTFTVDYKEIDRNLISLQIRVQDTGMGIKKEDMEKLFSPFERIEEGKNKTIEGTGLGMSIVKKMLAMMNTKLEVESEYGKGSNFHFDVEQTVFDWTEVGDINETYQQSIASMSKYTEKLHAPKAHLLFVDDTEMNLEVVKGLLKKTGIKLDTVLSGKEALEKVKENAYDIMFIDHRMPEMDGIQTLHAMQTLDGNKSAGKPTVALTANAISGVKQMYLDEGFTDYLSKPVNPDKLEAMIRKYLPADLIETNSASDQADAAEDSADSGNGSALVEQLRAIDGVDADMALQNCGIEDVLQTSLQKYYDTIDEKAAELQSLFDAADWQNYGTKVHSLKSTSRLIGLSELAAQAEHLEHTADAAIGEDADAASAAREEIQTKHQPLMELFTSYKEKLTPVVTNADDAAPNGSTAPALSEEALKEKLSKLFALADDFDIDGLDALIKELSAVRLPETFTEVFKQIRTCVENVDFTELKTVLHNAGVSE